MNFQTNALFTIKELRQKLNSNKFSCSEIDLKQYNYEFSAVKSNQKFKVQVYFGKKGVKTVIQGNNTSPHYDELNSIISGNYSLPLKTNNDETFAEYIGTDETGKGDYFGPLIVAAFFVNEKVQKSLIDFGVKDSKELSDPQINGIAKLLIKEFPNFYSTKILLPKDYNTAHEHYKNLNKILNIQHSLAIEKQFKNTPTDVVITDKFSNEKLNVAIKK